MNPARELAPARSCTLSRGDESAMNCRQACSAPVQYPHDHRGDSQASGPGEIREKRPRPCHREASRIAPRFPPVKSEFAKAQGVVRCLSHMLHMRGPVHRGLGPPNHAGGLAFVGVKKGWPGARGVLCARVRRGDGLLPPASVAVLNVSGYALTAYGVLITGE